MKSISVFEGEQSNSNSILTRSPSFPIPDLLRLGAMFTSSRTHTRYPSPHSSSFSEEQTTNVDDESTKCQTFRDVSIELIDYSLSSTMF